MKENARKNGHAWQVNHVGSIGSLFFTEQQVVDYASAKTSDTAEYARYFKYMLDNGIHLAPAQFEAMGGEFLNVQMNEFPEEHVKVSSLEFVHFAHCQKLLACQRSLKRKIEQP